MLHIEIEYFHSDSDTANETKRIIPIGVVSYHVIFFHLDLNFRKFTNVDSKIILFSHGFFTMFDIFCFRDVFDWVHTLKVLIQNNSEFTISTPHNCMNTLLLQKYK